MIKVCIDSPKKMFSSGNHIGIEFHGFSGGERNVKINMEHVDTLARAEHVYVEAHIRSSDDFMDLVLVTDALREIRALKFAKFCLAIPYVPYARQDRVMNAGEAHGIRAFSRLLNSLKYDEVVISDPHSDVTTALIDNVVVLEQAQVVASILHPSNFDILVAPDAGAIKKTNKLAKLWGKSEVGVGSKNRDLLTGAITGTSYNGPSVSGKRVIMVDDIGDGLRTFLELGKVLKAQGASEVSLYVTHGIFAYGVDICEGIIDNIYSTNTWDDNIEGRNEKGIFKGVGNDTQGRG